MVGTGTGSFEEAAVVVETRELADGCGSADWQPISIVSAATITTKRPRRSGHRTFHHLPCG
ncbi:MAG: hypothetical protein M3Y91_06160 [Actinomycetota bacterium]|nr:hypothetical protein [Actinomycetota bacterium]